MNLGVYVSSLGDSELLRNISDGLNFGIESRFIKDASIFYDNVSYNPFVVKCGMFNSTELWNFSGSLITTSLSTSISALKIVNKIDLYYYYGLEKNLNVLNLINILNNKINVISIDENMDNDLYRKTGIRSKLIGSSFKELITQLG